MRTITRQKAGATGLVTLPQVNLLPLEIIERRRLRVVQAGLGGAVALALVLLVGLYFLAASAVSSSQSDLTAAQAENALVQKQVNGFANVGQTYALVDKAHGLLRDAGGGEVLWSRYLTDLSLKIPSTVWLNQVTVAPAAAAPVTALTGVTPAIATITFTGVALSHDDVAVWLDALASERGWTDPYFSTSTEQYIGSHQTYTFTSSVTVTAAALSGRYTTPAGG